VESLDSARGRARFILPQLPAEAGTPPTDEAIADALGLSPSDLGIGRMRPARWSAGIVVAFVPVGGLSAVRDCRPEMDKLVSVFGGEPVYVFCPETVEPGHHYHARMFAPALGVAEDPATGAAAAALAGIVGKHGALPDGDHTISIEQGYEMGRPSLINLGLTLAHRRVVSAWIGGEAIVVTEGMIAT
jgi:trans-2,3-dihydro-3-hydroxyanthranilate isomerase